MANLHYKLFLNTVRMLSKISQNDDDSRLLAFGLGDFGGGENDEFRYTFGKNGGFM